ncbi:hypothetical protein J1N35_033791 [Gossypium stocksii]|uniref:Uncharacterized protein n=1 Tax=Gossypium stocksii TaxID=47602 RepID=A0A9D3UQR6_9ROSI|nr:hypothetical protein J1N35_033791 [Gossypium stocksii]
MVFRSLSKDFIGFWAAYNVGNKNLMLTQIMKELQSYELMLNGGQSIRKAEANIIVTSSSKGKGKHAKKDKAKTTMAVESVGDVHVAPLAGSELENAIVIFRATTVE